jgi:hypothetical protein
MAWQYHRYAMHQCQTENSILYLWYCRAIRGVFFIARLLRSRSPRSIQFLQTIMSQETPSNCEPPKPADPRVALAGERTGMASFRTQLALDRTTLAWIRTALSLAGFGFGMVGFFRSLQEKSPSPESVRLHDGLTGAKEKSSRLEE